VKVLKLGACLCRGDLVLCLAAGQAGSCLQSYLDCSREGFGFGVSLCGNDHLAFLQALCQWAVAQTVSPRYEFGTILCMW
jgi:hypothetical protein